MDWNKGLLSGVGGGYKGGDVDGTLNFLGFDLLA